jgi:protein TonB
MALPLMLLTAGLGRSRQPSIADARYGYQPTGRHETTAATLTALVTAGVGLSLATALVMPDVIKKVSEPFEGTAIPLTQPKPTPPEPQTDPRTPQSENHITTVVSPLPPVTGESPVVPYTPVDLGPVGPIPGPTADPGPIADPLPPHVPVWREATRHPRFVDRFQPPYPSAMQREGVEGSCPVSVTINAIGRVTSVRDMGCSDPAFFRATERQALSQWRFVPATRDGEAAETTQTLTVRFRITDDR